MQQRIFLTVGSQMPFDRLVRAANVWARTRPHWTVQAQIGHSVLQVDELDALQWQPLMSEAQFRDQCRQADFIVAHAGMGSVLTALEFSRPLVLMPRRAVHRETRNDHQMGTARWLMQQPGVELALDEHELPHAMDRMVRQLSGTPQGPMTNAVANAGATALRARCEGPLVAHLAELVLACGAGPQASPSASGRVDGVRQ